MMQNGQILPSVSATRMKRLVMIPVCFSIAACAAVETTGTVVRGTGTVLGTGIQATGVAVGGAVRAVTFSDMSPPTLVSTTQFDLNPNEVTQ